MAKLAGEEDGPFLVLLNEEGQHFLWPKAVAVPAGSSEVHSFDDWQNGLAYIKGLTLRRFLTH